MMQILEPGKKISESVIADLEQFADVSLPEDYRNFLLRYNGGRPVPDSFYFKGSSRGSTVDWFLGLDETESNNLPSYLQIYENRIPNNFFPIASDPGDNLICISVSGSDKGSIYFWDHERENEEDGSHDYSNVILVADSFVEFIDQLHAIEI